MKPKSSLAEKGILFGFGSAVLFGVIWALTMPAGPDMVHDFSGKLATLGGAVVLVSLVMHGLSFFMRPGSLNPVGMPQGSDH